MSRISNHQLFDLLCEVADGIDRLDAELDDVLALTRTINYEAELWQQRIDATKASYRPFKGSPSP